MRVIFLKKSVFFVLFFFSALHIHGRYTFDSIHSYALKINKSLKGSIKASQHKHSPTCPHQKHQGYSIHTKKYIFWVIPQEFENSAQRSVNELILKNFLDYLIESQKDEKQIVLVDISFNNFKNKKRTEIFEVLKFLGFKKIHINPIVMERFEWFFQLSDHELKGETD